MLTELQKIRNRADVAREQTPSTRNEQSIVWLDNYQEMTQRYATQDEFEVLVAALAQMATNVLPQGPTGRPASVRHRVTHQGRVKLRLFAPAYEYHVEVDQVRSATAPNVLAT